MSLGNKAPISEEDLQFHMKADSIVPFFPTRIIFSKVFTSDTENPSAQRVFFRQKISNWNRDMWREML